MRPGIPLLLILFATPLASAVPVEIGMEESAGVYLRGPVRIEAPLGVVDASADIGAGRAWTITWEHAEGYVVTREATYVASPSLGQLDDIGPPKNESARYGAGAINLSKCSGTRCVALVLAEEQGRVRAEGVSDGSLVAAPEARAYFAGYRSGQSSDDSNSFNYEVGRGWAQAAGATDADALPLGNARFQGAGRLTLFLDGPEGRVEADGQSLSYRTGNETEQSSGLAMTGKHVRRFIVLHLEGAAFDTGPGSGAILAAPRVDVRVDGAFAGSGVAGYARVGKDRWDLDHVDVRAEGAFSASVAWAQASLPVPVAQEGPEGVVEGDATSVWIDGLRVGAPAPTALERLEPALAVVLLGLLVALLKTGAFWSFYSRIADADVLANENRRAIYQLLQKGFRGPITSVAKSVGVSVAVAAYHARLLQARGLVVSAREGRVRVLGAAAGGRLAEDVRAELALKVDRRRRIASAVASASGGLTQAEIVSRTGDSQRLVSHHLALLVELGLLVRNDGRPARYVATDALQSRALGEKRAEASAGTTAASVG